MGGEVEENRDAEDSQVPRGGLVSQLVTRSDDLSIPNHSSDR